MTPREDRVTFEGFDRSRLLLALPKQHPLTTKKHIEVNDLHELPLVRMRGDIEPRFGESLKTLFSLIVRPRVFHEVTNQSEALELVSHHGVAALTTPVAQHPPTDRVVFRKFFDDILIADPGIAYFGEPVSPILRSLRKFLAETFQALAGRWEKDAMGGRWVVLKCSEMGAKTKGI